MKHFYFACYLLLCIHAYSQKEYAVNTIDPALRKEADVVIRNNEYIYTLLTPGKANEYEKIVVTILNEKGENRFSSFSRAYSKFFEITKLEGHVYDSLGQKIKNIRKSNIQDYGSSYAAYEITDEREKEISFGRKKYAYPYTIEFICEWEVKIGMFYPTWFPMEGARTGIEKTSFTMISPKGMNFRYKEVNLSATALVTHYNETDSYRWELKHILPQNIEAYMPPNSFPLLYTAPNEFEAQSYKGNASSWESIGAFYLNLNANRQDLPEATKLKVKELIKDETDTLRQIEILYKYMQANTRYISIQLGIGGWQTMKASDVAQKGYGDCKALSNYMIALLKEAGIKADPVLIKAGEPGNLTQPDFPSYSFNHAIACVPLHQDTVWLECTSQVDPAGYLGSFTGNRKALVVNESGSKLVNTIHYTSQQNAQLRKAEVWIDSTGNALASIRTIYKGIQQEEINHQFTTLDKSRQRESIIKKLSIPNFELTDFSLKAWPSALPEMEEQLRLKIHKLIPVNNSAVFITPNLLPAPIYIDPANAERKSPFYLEPNTFNYSTSDTIVYHLPTLYTVQALPQPVRIESFFGTYALTFAYANHQLLYTRSLTLKGGTFPAAEYANWTAFIKQINKQDKQKLMLKKLNE